ncbi:unnamed protein product, partial [marine sediment metagenome]
TYITNLKSLIDRDLTLYKALQTNKFNQDQGSNCALLLLNEKKNYLTNMKKKFKVYTDDYVENIESISNHKIIKSEKISNNNLSDTL